MFAPPLEATSVAGSRKRRSIAANYRQPGHDDESRPKAILLLRRVLLPVKQAHPVNELAVTILKTICPHASAPLAAAEYAVSLGILELYQKIWVCFASVKRLLPLSLTVLILTLREYTSPVLCSSPCLHGFRHACTDVVIGQHRRVGSRPGAACASGSAVWLPGPAPMSRPSRRR